MTQLQIGWCPAACPWWKCFYVFFSLCLLESASDSPTEEDLIRKYFHDGYIDDEILDFLATTHNVKMSLRTLKSKLNSCSLSRQKYYSPLVVRVAIQEELKGPGQHYGCHMMLPRTICIVPQNVGSYQWSHSRTDCGTESGTMVAIHCALRSSHIGFAGAASHMYGSSTANQRIESWWSFIQKQRCGPQHLFLHP